MNVQLTIPIPVSINKLYINQYKFNSITKKKEPTGARILSVEGVNSKKRIQKEAIKQMKTQSWSYEYTKNNYIYIDLVFFFNRMGRDSDNCLKLLQDSLQGIVYDNDSRVLCRVQRVMYDSDNPRVELYIHPVDYVGIFDSKDEFDEFESNCKNCKRYARNCSILAKAKEGRIQEEIDTDYYCSKFVESKS